nr:DUF551 domain-containing protein [Bacteroides finegoldii]
MKQTVEEGAREARMTSAETLTTYGMHTSLDDFTYLSHDEIAENAFVKGAEWQAKQSPWIRVEERLPDEGQRVLVGFLYYYKYDNREAESRKHIDIFTYENGVWTTDCDISYLGRNVQKDDIKVVCWMPIPSFDEILEANRDVLERIKEKGD